MAEWTDTAAREREAAAAAHSARADANLIGLLGLELLLLVFFILLSGAGRIDAERAEPVLSGLRLAFAPVLVEGIPEIAGGDLVGSPRMLRDRFGERIRTLLPLAQIEASGDPDRLAVSLPAGGFFAAGEATLSPLAHERLARIAAAIEEAAAGNRFSLAVALAPAMPDAHARAAALGAAFARLLGESRPLAITVDGEAAPDRVRLLVGFGGEAAP